jgi:hypothetical protein
MSGSFHDMFLPPELSRLLSPLDMPLSEIACLIADVNQSLSEMRVLSSKHALVFVSPMFDFEYAMVMRKQAGHQTRSRGRASGAGCVSILKRDASPSQLFQVRRQARVPWFNRGGLHAVSQNDEDVWLAHFGVQLALSWL